MVDIVYIHRHIHRVIQMLSTDTELVLWAFCSANTFAILILAYTSWNQSKKHGRRHRHASLESSLSEAQTDLITITDRVEALATALKRRTARETMRERRNGSTNAGIPDPKVDPDGWKREMMKRHVLGGNKA